jgi:hypothetical protein
MARRRRQGHLRTPCDTRIMREECRHRQLAGHPSKPARNQGRATKGWIPSLSWHVLGPVLCRGNRLKVTEQRNTCDITTMMCMPMPTVIYALFFCPTLSLSILMVPSMPCLYLRLSCTVPPLPLSSARSTFSPLPSRRVRVLSAVSSLSSSPSLSPIT